MQRGRNNSTAHSPGRVGADLLELLTGAAKLCWIRLRSVLRAGVERAVLRLVVVTEELRCVRLLQGRVSKRDGARIRSAVPLTSSSARPPRHDEQMPMECGCKCRSREIKELSRCGEGASNACVSLEYYVQCIAGVIARASMREHAAALSRTTDRGWRWAAAGDALLPCDDRRGNRKSPGVLAGRTEPHRRCFEAATSAPYRSPWPSSFQPTPCWTCPGRLQHGLCQLRQATAPTSLCLESCMTFLLIAVRVSQRTPMLLPLPCPSCHLLCLLF